MEEFNKLFTDVIIMDIHVNRGNRVYPCLGFGLELGFCKCREINLDCTRCPLNTWDSFDAYLLSIELPDSLFSNIIY